MKFNLDKSLEILERSPDVLLSLLRGLSNLLNAKFITSIKDMFYESLMICQLNYPVFGKVAPVSAINTIGYMVCVAITD
jgi:hypothetical protein